jgi:heme O synthase-like polyprenyltransferase
LAAASIKAAVSVPVHIASMIVSIATSADASVRERDIQRLMQRLQQRPTAVHVVMVSAPQRSSTGGSTSWVAQAATQMTRDRYENITVPNFMMTLLPRFAEQLVTVHARPGTSSS